MNFVIWLTVALFAYRIIVEYILPPKWHFSASILMTYSAIVWAYANNLSLWDLHLVPSFSWLSLSVIMGAILGCYVVLYVSTTIPFFRNFYLSDTRKPMTRRKIIGETIWRIPMGTALTEEILFRGVLFGSILQITTPIWAIFWSSCIFGFWHVFGPIKVGGSFMTMSRRTIGHVIATTTGGIIMSILCLVDGSIIIPWLFHWTINSAGLLTVHYTKNKHRARI